MLLTASFSEITLKGANRFQFEILLVKNLKVALIANGITEFKVQKKRGRLLISTQSENALEIVQKVFGIDFVTSAVETECSIEAITAKVSEFVPRLHGKKIRVETKRSDKRFPIQSQRVNEIVGEMLYNSGCKVDLENPDQTIYIDILNDRALIYLDRVQAFGGLPVGSSGKVLSLLSGGIDSPVASWLMMKRGCCIDFLHLHQFATNEEAKQSKLIRLAQTIRAYSPIPMRIYLVPYHEFYKKSMQMDSKAELVIFRRFILHLANSLAEQHNYKAVVSGDSLGQVASQTLVNLATTNAAAKIPVFRPLTGYNKQEIVDLARKIGSYKISIEPYKDCCSLVATKSPSLKVPLEVAEKAEQDIDIASVVARTLEKTEVIEV